MDFSAKLLTVLQLTRMALVFTAISNVLAGLLLRVYLDPDHGGAFTYWHALLVAIIAGGLYGFGMSLNDIIDRRRDRLTASHRPLPSGRIGVVAAHVICGSLALLAVVGAFVFAQFSPRGSISLAVVLWCLALIAFYDLVGKYLVAAGLIALGLIRFFLAAAPQPTLLVPWHPLLLFNHVAILSAACYVLERKRPVFTRRHRAATIAGIVMVNVAVIVVLWQRRTGGSFDLDLLASRLAIRWSLLYVAAAVAGFGIASLLILRRERERRVAGQQLMLAGLLWLIVYDAAFALAYVGRVQATILVALLPVSYLSVQLMRWWSKLLHLGQKPQFIRAR